MNAEKPPSPVELFEPPPQILLLLVTDTLSRCGELESDPRKDIESKIDDVPLFVLEWLSSSIELPVKECSSPRTGADVGIVVSEICVEGTAVFGSPAREPIFDVNNVEDTGASNEEVPFTVSFPVICVFPAEPSNAFIGASKDEVASYVFECELLLGVIENESLPCKETEDCSNGCGRNGGGPACGWVVCS